MPIVYNPTSVKCPRPIGHVFQQGRGCDHSDMQGGIEAAIANCLPRARREAVVVTDNEAILGSRSGAAAMGHIPRQLDLYIAGAGMHPGETCR